MARKNNTSQILKYMAAGLLISAVVMIGTRFILPLLLGVSFTGLLAMVGNRLSAIGGVLGSVTGGLAEMVSNFSNFVVQPLFNLNPFAIIGFAGVVTLCSVFIVNIYTYDEVWM